MRKKRRGKEWLSFFTPEIQGRKEPFSTSRFPSFMAAKKTADRFESNTVPF